MLISVTGTTGTTWSHDCADLVIRDGLFMLYGFDKRLVAVFPVRNVVRLTVVGGRKIIPGPRSGPDNLSVGKG